MSVFNTNGTVMVGSKNMASQRSLFRLSPEMELYTMVVNTLGLDGGFFEGGNERMRRLRALVEKCDHRFVARLAIYARTTMGLRTVPMLLIVELAKIHRGDSLVSKTVARCVQRADEITELLACYMWANKKDQLDGLSAQIRNGLSKVFGKFDEYQFAKYSIPVRRGDKQKPVTTRDAMCVVHPTPKNEQQAQLFAKVAREELEPPYTWEHQLAELRKHEYKSEIERYDAEIKMWMDLVVSNRLGYMAMLRNVDRMLDLDYNGQLTKLLVERLVDEHLILSSRIMPTQLFLAWGNIYWSEFACPYRVYDPIDKEITETNYRISWLESSLEWHQYISARWRVVRRRSKLTGLSLNNPDAVYELQKLKAELEGTQFQGYKDRIVGIHHVKYKWIKVKRRHTNRVVRRIQRDLKREIAHLKALSIHRRKVIVANYQYKENCKMIGQAINTAFDKLIDSSMLSYGPGTRVLIASGMTPAMSCRPISKGSRVTLRMVSAALGVMLAAKCKEVTLGRLSNKFTPFPLRFMSFSQCSEDYEKVWRTSANQDPLNSLGVLKWMTKNRHVADRVFIITDGQILFDDMFTQQWLKYKRLVNPEAKMVIIDIAGYGETPIVPGTDDVITVAGWTPAVFDIIASVEQGNSVLKTIRDIPLNI